MLSDAYPQLLRTLIERHGVVSANKNRQRWCYLDGNTVIQDDLQPMNLGFHAVRFPQLYAICASNTMSSALTRSYVLLG